MALARGILNRTSNYYLLCVTASWQGAFHVFHTLTRPLLAFPSKVLVMEPVHNCSTIISLR